VADDFIGDKMSTMALEIKVKGYNAFNTPPYFTGGWTVSDETGVYMEGKTIDYLGGDLDHPVLELLLKEGDSFKWSWAAKDDDNDLITFKLLLTSLDSQAYIFQKYTLNDYKYDINQKKVEFEVD